MARARETAYRLRGLLLAAGVLYTLLALTFVVLPYFNDTIFVNSIFGQGPQNIAVGLMFTPLSWHEPDPNWDYAYARDALFVLGSLLLAQWVFLRPGRNWTPKLTSRGRPLKSAILAAALMAALLTVGLLSLLLELPDLWLQSLEHAQAYPVVGLHPFGVVWAAMLILWLVWAGLFFVYWHQGDRYTQLGKMIRGLIAGSILEVLVAIPVHAWATRQRECYCLRGTYTTLVLAGTVLIWAFGPGILLLYWREKYRREKLFRPSEGGFEVGRGAGDVK